MLRGEPLHLADRIAGRNAGRGQPLKLGGGEEVVASDSHGAAALAERRDGRQGHHLPARRADLEPADIRQRVARRWLRLGDDPEGTAEQVEIVDVGRAEIGTERAVDLARLDPEQLGAITVDVRLDARAAGVEQREDLGDLLRLGGGTHHREGRALKRREAGVRSILDLHREAAAVTEALDGGRRQEEDLGTLFGLGDRAGDLPGKRGRGQIRAAPFGEILELEEQHGAVRGLAEAGAVEPGEGAGIDYRRIMGGDVERVQHRPVGAFER